MTGPKAARPGIQVKVFAATAALSWAAALIFSVFEQRTHGATAIWPVNAMILAAYILLGREARAAVIAGGAAALIATSLVMNTNPRLACVLAIFNSTEIVLVHLVAARVLKGRFSFEGVDRLLAYWSACAAVCAVNALPVGFVELAWQGRPFWTTFNAWGVGDALGYMLVTPAILDIRHDWAALAADSRRGVHALATVAALLLVEAPVLYFRAYELQFAILVIFVAIAFRQGRTVAGLAILSTIVLADGLLNFGSPRAPVVFGLVIDEKLYAQIFLAGCALAAIPMAGAVAKQRALDAELIASRTEALAASEAKSQFLANMSHEMRTPLNAVIGFAGLLQGMAELPGPARRHADRIAAGGRALLDLVNDVLDFAKVESGHVDLACEMVELHRLVAETVDLVAADATAKGLGLDWAMDEATPALIQGDARRLRQVLLNLLGNAVKFTERGAVRVSVAPAGESIRFSVTDTGPGIAPDFRDRLFDRFSQGDASLSRSHGGAGLGLAISRGLVELMGGRIGVTSELGQGSMFWFEIPARAPAAAAPPHWRALPSISSPSAKGSSVSSF
ncbi:ATP-binding protein [Phenylobacterium montanum]|uniref:histidine kinase n=1 Tax=Phenylobacterium montanum TaxID=2823693 RepID=A0A975FWQ6_9CAUL|nr:ATP-binding protein [Caulobacter sp. S6]QUD86695.1 MASE1 domain-containing protein [Caulobacter sp. S6]